MGTAQDLVREFDAVFNARRLDALSQVMAADVVMVSPRGAARGVEQVRALLEPGFAIFADLVVEPVVMLEDGPSVAVQQRFTAGSLAACELVWWTPATG